MCIRDSIIPIQWCKHYASILKHHLLCSVWIVESTSICVINPTNSHVSRYESLVLNYQSKLQLIFFTFFIHFYYFFNCNSTYKFINVYILSLMNLLLSPVSYTHLDVYKRQVYDSVSNTGTHEVKLNITIL